MWWVRKALTFAESSGLTSRSTPKMGGTQRLWHWAWMDQPISSRADVLTCSGPWAGWEGQGAQGSAQLPLPSLAAKAKLGLGTKKPMVCWWVWPRIRPTRVLCRTRRSRWYLKDAIYPLSMEVCGYGFIKCYVGARPSSPIGSLTLCMSFTRGGKLSRIRRMACSGGSLK